MTVKINSISLTLPDIATLQDALDAKNIPSKGIAIAVNGRVVPSSERSKYLLRDGDNIVIIKAFYGG
ncbi:MAG: sulfur carrier protein ThiS [Duncaniella sp.]|nr:sulfur carrier protein ThiS [Muribaculum sp.]MCM1255815.1 sulfur carrier protein ThiS [Duncaniella sp.]